MLDRAYEDFEVTMASGAALAPQMEQPDPLIDGHSGGASPTKPNNSPELGQEPLSDGPNKSLCLSLSVLSLP
jgi:hypothetical protein